MTRTRIAKAAAALSLALATGVAVADTQSVTVQANVQGLCKFNTGQSPVMDFGTIDPSGSTSATASVNVLYRCTKGTAVTAVTPTGARTLAGTGTAAGDTMSYTLAVTSGGTGTTGTGFGTGNDLTLALGGTITAANYQNKTVGAYSETVTVTITP